MTNLKKLGALLLVVVMMLSLSVSAFASSADLAGDGVVGDFTNDNIQAQNKSVTLYKEITAYNPSTSDVTINAPTITYTYTVLRVLRTRKSMM